MAVETAGPEVQLEPGKPVKLGETLSAHPTQSFRVGSRLNHTTQRIGDTPLDL